MVLTGVDSIFTLSGCSLVEILFGGELDDERSKSDEKTKIIELKYGKICRQEYASLPGVSSTLIDRSDKVSSLVRLLQETAYGQKKIIRVFSEAKNVSMSRTIRSDPTVTLTKRLK